MSLEQNDLTFCQSLPGGDKPNDVNNNRRRSNPIGSRQQQFHRPQSELHPPPSSLFLKNLCKKKNTSGSNDHLLAKDGLRSQSASVDQINAFRANDPRDGLRLDDLYRSKVCQAIGGGSHDNVRFSLDNVLDNVSLRTYASSFSAYNSVQNTIQHSLQSGLQDGIPDSFQDCSSGSAFSDSPIAGRISRKSTSRPNSKLLPGSSDPHHLASAPQSSKSINLDGPSSTASINDQQSNDSKMPKKEGEPFNNLSATVV